MDFLKTLDPLLKTLWFIALPFSLIFVIQSTMTFAGIDSHDELNTDSDVHEGGAPFHLFTFRNLVNFMLGFSWTGISFYALIQSKVVLIALSLIVGAIFVMVFFLIIRQIERLAEDNSFKMVHSLNKTGSVYLPIPARKSGTGKVQVSVNGAFHELDAITENDKIETSAMVRIVKIESNNLVLVERI